MEAKYYTPERNEFHEGFIFEANYKKEGWQKEIFGIGERSISSVPQLLYQFLDGMPLEGNIRVKYLDREDVESLGFEFSENYADRPILGFLYESKENKELQYLLYYNVLTNELRIERIFQCGTAKEDYLFNGFIKNKSELIRLMRQLNIKNG